MRLLETVQKWSKMLTSTQNSTTTLVESKETQTRLSLMHGALFSRVTMKLLAKSSDKPMIGKIVSIKQNKKVQNY